MLCVCGHVDNKVTCTLILKDTHVLRLQESKQKISNKQIRFALSSLPAATCCVNNQMKKHAAFKVPCQELRKCISLNVLDACKERFFVKWNPALIGNLFFPLPSSQSRCSRGLVVNDCCISPAGFCG